MADSELTSRREGDVAVITAPNYINQDGGEQISNAASTLKEEGCNRLVLNLTDCSLANSVGISFLIEVLEANNVSDGLPRRPHVQSSFTGGAADGKQRDRLSRSRDSRLDTALEEPCRVGVA